MTEPYWKCPKCGLELSFEEVCNSSGHSHKEILQTEVEKAAQKVARTGNREDLQEYLKLRRNFL